MNKFKTLNREERRKYIRQIHENNKRRPRTLTEIPKDDWPKMPSKPNKLISAWHSRDFLVQIYEDCDVIRLSVCRTSLKPDGNYDDNISWDELMEIKSAVGYRDFYAMEIYPREIDIVNVANMRHLFILPEPLKYGWFKNQE